MRWLVALRLSLVPLWIQLEESERAASKHAKLCTARLNYLQQVDQLAVQNKNGHADFESLEEEEQGGAFMGVQGESQPPPRKAVRAARNVHDTEMDASSQPISLSLTAASPAMPAAKPDEEDRAAEAFTVTPRMRLDRIFADHLLRTSQSHFRLSMVQLGMGGLCDARC